MATLQTEGCKFETRLHGFPRLPFWQFYIQNLVPDPQKLGVRVLGDAYMINPKLDLFIYGHVWFKGQYFGTIINLF